MKSLKDNRKGITLVSLVITIVVLLILASIATYSGIEVIKSSRLTTFTTEMKIMQTQVNELYQRYKDGDNTVLGLGKDLDSVSEQANKVFTEKESGITDQNEYQYFDQNTIKNVLKIEGVEGEFFVNIKNRSVVSYQGFQYEGKTYYTLEQLPNGLYNVEYMEKNINVDKPTFDTSVEKVSEGKWRVTVSNIQYNGYIDKWQVKYKLNNQDNWNTSEDLSFVVNEEGNYLIQIVNGNIKSQEKERPVWEEYVGKGMLLYLDGINNTRNGHDNNTTVWEDLSGNNYDFIKLASAQNAIWSENSYVGDGTDRTLYYNQAILADATECTIEVCYDVPKLTNYIWVFQSRDSDKGANGFQFLVNSNRRMATVFLTYNDYKTLGDFVDCTDINGRTMGIALNNQTIEFSNNTDFYSTDVDEGYMQSVAPRTNYTIGSTYPWGIGLNGFYFQGNIYAIRIYNRKLSEAEIAYNCEIDKLRFNLE